MAHNLQLPHLNLHMRMLPACFTMKFKILRRTNALILQVEEAEVN